MEFQNVILNGCGFSYSFTPYYRDYPESPDGATFFDSSATDHEEHELVIGDLDQPGVVGLEKFIPRLIESDEQVPSLNGFYNFADPPCRPYGMPYQVSFGDHHIVPH